MATNIAYDGPKSGIQIGQSNGHIIGQFSR